MRMLPGAAAVAMAVASGAASATTVVTAAHLFDPARGITVDNAVVVRPGGAPATP